MASALLSLFKYKCRLQVAFAGIPKIRHFSQPTIELVTDIIFLLGIYFERLMDSKKRKKRRKKTGEEI